MKSAMSKHLLLALALGVLTLAAPAEAQRNRAPRDQLWPDASTQRRDEGERRRISIEQAIDSVRSATGGRVLDVRDRGDEYRIKVLTRDGEVRTVRVDAYSGALR
ncbi:MAG TPA: hypothetical protein VNM24_00925 [Burkholderiales bacterium]|jgi:uncharacterized membrane protein YkoI|nr:hypothetical protein [Burkholderiales bacterium]